MTNPFVKMKKEKTLLEVEIEHVMDVLKCIDPQSDDYETVSKNLERLYKLKLEEESKKTKIEPKDILSTATNLLDIGFIMQHERLHVLTTKAMNFIHKGRF